jgi:hypothetical protein
MNVGMVVWGLGWVLLIPIYQFEINASRINFINNEL